MNCRFVVIAALLAAGPLAVARAFAQQPTPSPTPTPAATASPRPSRSAEGPFAEPVPGHPGFVYSPYVSADAGNVDVRGFKSGDAVRCPYTNKIFLVP